MKAAAFFAAIETMPVGSLDQLTAMRPFVIVAPHPDDETLGCAGLMTAARMQGLSFRIVIVTDGRASHPNSVLYPPERLINMRHQESRDAAACCSVPPNWIRFLDLRDSEVPRAGAVFDQTADAICTTIHEVSARTVIATWQGDPHCDHEAAHDIARAAAARTGARFWSYPIWGWTLPANKSLARPSPTGLRLDVSRWQEVKHRAIQCHRSQVTPLVSDDSSGFTITPDMLNRFRGQFEHFINEPT